VTKRLLLAAVLVAAMASTALAAAGDPAVQRNGYWWNPTTGAKTDGDGNAYVNPVQNWTYFSKMFADTLSPVTKRSDSTGVYPVGPYGSGVLYLYPWVIERTPTLKADSFVVAVQVRGHFQQSADSSSTFPLMPFSGGAFGSGPNMRDVGGHFGQLATAASGSTLGLPAWNEYVIVFKSDPALRDSIASQVPVGKGVPIPLYNLWTPYLSVRFRSLTRTDRTTPQVLRLDATYVGTPLK